MIFLWKAAQGTIPKKKPHTLRLAAQASCSQKQIKTSDTERTLMTMITVVWGQITNWSSFKDQARDMRHRSWITVLQHSPAQVLLPRFSSVYSSHPLFSFPVWERDRRIMQVSSLLTAGMATRGSVPSGSSSTGQKEDELLGLHQEAHTAAQSRSSVHRAFQSHQHFWSPPFHQHDVWLEHRGRLSAKPCWSGTISRGLTKGAHQPPNLDYCHPNPLVLLRWVSKSPSWGG